MWHLAWRGEVSCDTYECVRNGGFEASLSGCYDLMHRPVEIFRGKDSHERVVERMKRRGLDPTLGRWWPTERLRPPLQPLPANDVAREWAGLLLRRWGIVSRDTLQDEAAAPSWGALVRELKRMELLGKVNRGYFIEGQSGEQYGLPNVPKDVSVMGFDLSRLFFEGALLRYTRRLYLYPREFFQCQG